MRIAFGNDHAALDMKKEIIALVQAMGHEVVDFGTFTNESCDYPLYAYRAAQAVQSKDCDLGIVLCGTGIGVSLAANKVRGIRCALAGDPFSAAMARRHNNANMLAMGARVIGPELAKVIARAFLETEFEGGRHARRVDLISAIERGDSPE